MGASEEEGRRERARIAKLAFSLNARARKTKTVIPSRKRRKGKKKS